MQRAAAAGGFSLSTKRSAEAAAVDTRDRKQYGVDTHTWREEIEARASEHGLDRETVDDLVARGRHRLERGYVRAVPDVDTLAMRLVGEHGLTEHVR